METQQLSVGEALAELNHLSAQGVLTIGDVDLNLLHDILAACQPKPVKLGIYNASDPTVAAIKDYDVELRVGSQVSEVEAEIRVYADGDRFTFSSRSVEKQKGCSGAFSDTLEILVPYDGVSLHSSLRSLPPARKELLDDLAAVTKPTSESWRRYKTLRVLPSNLKTALITAGIFALGSALRPGFGLSELGFLAAGGVAGYFYAKLRGLQRTFGFQLNQP